MNIAIVDDVEADRQRLESVLREYDRIHHFGMVYHHFSGGEALIREYTPFTYAIVFLDIYMAGMSGMEAAKAIRRADDDANIVFLTTSEAHRADAFSVFASDYLGKPVASEQVFRTLDHLFKIKTGGGKRFSFSYDRKDYSLLCADIVSLEKDGNYLDITDKNGRAYRTRMTFSEAENLVDSHFLTLMKGIMVNMRYIKQIRNGQCLMHNGATFPLHVRNARELQQKWLTYKFTVIRNDSSQGEDETQC